MIRRGKVFVGRIGGFRADDRRTDQDPVTEGDTAMRGEREIQFLFAFAENFFAQRIGGEQTIAAGMPVSGKSGIGGMIENGDGHWLLANHTTEVAPAASRPPRS